MKKVVKFINTDESLETKKRKCIFIFIKTEPKTQGGREKSIDHVVFFIYLPYKNITLSPVICRN